MVYLVRGFMIGFGIFLFACGDPEEQGEADGDDGSGEEEACPADGFGSLDDCWLLTNVDQLDNGTPTLVDNLLTLDHSPTDSPGDSAFEMFRAADLRQDTTVTVHLSSHTLLRNSAPPGGDYGDIVIMNFLSQSAGWAAVQVMQNEEGDIACIGTSEGEEWFTGSCGASNPDSLYLQLSVMNSTVIARAGIDLEAMNDLSSLAYIVDPSDASTEISLKLYSAYDDGGLVVQFDELLIEQ